MSAARSDRDEIFRWLLNLNKQAKGSFILRCLIALWYMRT